MPLSFSINGASFTLTDSCLKEMALTLEKTKVKERGFRLCGDPSYLTPGRPHIGGAHTIFIRNCGGRPAYGSYHTHPEDDSDPSTQDIINIMFNSAKDHRVYLGCRGGQTDQLIRCDTVKRIPTIEEYSHLKRRKAKYLEPDYETTAILGTPYTFSVKEVPELIKPKAPPKPPVIVAKVCRYCGQPATFLFQGQWYCDQHFTMVIK